MNLIQAIFDGIGWGLVAFFVLPLWLYYAAKFFTIGYRIGLYRAGVIIEGLKRNEQ